MKKIKLQFFKANYQLFTLCAIGIASAITFSSCSKDNNDDDDPAPKTNVNGRPSKYEFASEDDRLEQASFFYTADKLTKIKRPTSEDIYTYTNSELTQVEGYNLSNKKGISFSKKFTKKDNIIEVEEKSGDPASTAYYHRIRTIELNSDNLPTKITYKYAESKENRSTSDIITLASDIFYTYDSAKRLVKIAMHNAQSSELDATVTFEYDNAPGSVSKNGLPNWYNVYQCDYSYSYANYINNLTKRTITSYNKNGAAPKIINYTYEYNKEGYPISVTQQTVGSEYIKTYHIEY